MNNQNIIDIFRLKSGKLNNNYKLIFGKLSTCDQDYIKSLFIEYEDLGDKLKSVIEGDYRKCPICQSAMSWKDKNKTCSKECSKVSLVQNQEQTNLERYGVRNAAMSEQFELKKQETNMKRYGVTHPLKSDNSMEKLRETNLERYGVKYAALNDEVKSKRKNTVLERYGVEYAAQNETIRNKNVATNLQRYGVEHPYQIEVVKDKVKFAIVNKKIEYVYNRVGVLLTHDEIKKLILDYRCNYSTNYINQLVEYVKHGTKPDLRLIKKEHIDTRWYEVAKHYGYEFDSISQPEKDIENWLISIGVKFTRNDRSIINPLELDFYLPDHNLAIEFNGYYWHSDLFKDKQYHQNKTKRCNDLGITLIHIYEQNFNMFDIYKNIISSKLGLNKTIYARKCTLAEISTEEERSFLNKYHLQGYVASKHKYGLYYDGELVSICTFKKSRFTSKYQYELIRNCTTPGITVVGGLSKLIKHFKTTVCSDDVICYSDASISFDKGQLTSPNYVWIKGSNVLKRYNTMKHKLKSILGDNYDERLSESENMYNNGYIRVYDSGNYITTL